jgi:D-alanyl-D-alanine carboxypeptidase/D-alanyl-D-alanine-endopeptidase (penicillin-binding protein 4)
MPRVLLATLATLALFAPAAQGQTQTSLQKSLSRQMAGAGHSSGAYVVDSETGAQLFSLRPDTSRILASNTKLFTSAAALGRLGADSTIATTLLGTGSLQPDGTWNGDLYLRGGGDPTFGDRRFNSAYGSDASVEAIAEQLADAGFTRVTGHVYGDESLFDSLRGGPESGYAFSVYIGAPLSALAFDRGLANQQGSAIQRRPARFAADRLRRALSVEGVSVAGGVGERATPSGAQQIAEVRSPPMATLARLTNVPSDNFFAETLLKDLGARARGRGTTAGGAASAMAYWNANGVFPRIADGSGLSRRNHTTPRQIVGLLDHMDRTAALAVPFRGSLAVACRSGTLAGRMCGTAAAGRCRAKTGTLSDVSALSGYCDVGGARVLAFSIIMNSVSVGGARSLQDRMGAAIAAYAPSSSSRAGSSMTSTPRR